MRRRSDGILSAQLQQLLFRFLCCVLSGDNADVREYRLVSWLLVESHRHAIVGIPLNVCCRIPRHDVHGELRADVRRKLRPDVRDELRGAHGLFIVLDMPKLHGWVRAVQHLRSAASDDAARVHNGLLVAVRHLRFRLLHMLGTSGYPNVVCAANLPDLQWRRRGDSNATDRAGHATEPGTDARTDV